MTPNQPCALVMTCTACNGSGDFPDTFTLPQTVYKLGPDPTECQTCKGKKEMRVPFNSLEELQRHVAGLVAKKTTGTEEGIPGYPRDIEDIPGYPVPWPRLTK